MSRTPEAANDNEVMTSARIAEYAAEVAELIDEYGVALMPIFKRLMREYKIAKEDEDALDAARAIVERQITDGGLKAIR